MIKIKKHTKHSRNSMELKATSSDSVKVLRSIFPDWTKGGLDHERLDGTSGEGFVDIKLIKDTGDRDERMMTLSPHWRGRGQTVQNNTVWIIVKRIFTPVDNHRFVCFVTFPHETGLDEFKFVFPATFKGFERFDVRRVATRALKHALVEVRLLKAHLQAQREAQPEPEPEPTPVIEFECVECGWITDTVHEQHHHFSGSEPDPVRSYRVRVDGVIYEDEEAYFSARADAVETLDELKAAKLDAYTGLLGRVCSTFLAES